MTQIIRAVNVLYALTGYLDIAGGNVLFSAAPTNPVAGMELLADEHKDKAIGLQARPLGPARYGFVTGEALHSTVLAGRAYRVRGLVTFGSNLVMGHGDSARGRDALQALEHHVHRDLFMGPTSEQADIVLPVISPFESEGLKVGFEVSRAGQSVVQLRDDPSGVRLPLRTQHRRYAAVDDHDIPAGFAPATGRIELYAEGFLELGQPPVATFTEPSMSPRSRPDLAQRFPLVLTCTKSLHLCESQHRRVGVLRSRAPDPEVEPHPDATAARGIDKGDRVQIATPKGSVRARAVLNRSLAPDAERSRERQLPVTRPDGRGDALGPATSRGAGAPVRGRLVNTPVHTRRLGGGGD